MRSQGTRTAHRKLARGRAAHAGLGQQEMAAFVSFQQGGERLPFLLCLSLALGGIEIDRHFLPPKSLPKPSRTSLASPAFSMATSASTSRWRSNVACPCFPPPRSATPLRFD